VGGGCPSVNKTKQLDNNMMDFMTEENSDQELEAKIEKMIQAKEAKKKQREAV